MRDLMELLCDYLTLEDKRSRGVALTATQHARWITLQKALPGTGNAPGPGPDREGGRETMRALVRRRP